MSDAQTQAFIWDNKDGDASGYQIDKEDGDRMYTFEITQINEQQENVVSKQGFRVIHIVASKSCIAVDISHSSFQSLCEFRRLQIMGLCLVLLPQS